MRYVLREIWFASFFWKKTNSCFSSCTNLSKILKLSWVFVLICHHLLIWQLVSNLCTMIFLFLYFHFSIIYFHIFVKKISRVIFNKFYFIKSYDNTFILAIFNMIFFSFQFLICFTFISMLYLYLQKEKNSLLFLALLLIIFCIQSFWFSRN